MEQRAVAENGVRSGMLNVGACMYRNVLRSRRAHVQLIGMQHTQSWIEVGDQSVRASDRHIRNMYIRVHVHV